MKKFSVLLTLAVLMVSSSVFAGSIDYLSNQSAKYCMNTASAARTDGADIVAYNPAGTALMGQGFFIDVSNQTLLKYYKQDVSSSSALFNPALDESYKQDTPTILLPNVYLAYNAGQVAMGKLAVYGQAGVVAGGGSLEWDGALATDDAAAGVAGMLTLAGAPTAITALDVKAEGSSVYYAFGGGAAYSLLDDMISVSAGAKYVMARRTGKLSGTIDYVTPSFGGAAAWQLDIDSEYSYDANGITYVLGLDAKPAKELTIGVMYQTETSLKFKYNQDKNDVSDTINGAIPGPVGTMNAYIDAAVTGILDKDGIKSQYNLPQILTFGAEYIVMPELTVSASSNIYFLSQADMDGYEDYFGTGWEVAFGAMYKVMEPLKVGASIMYTDQGAKDSLLKESTAVSTNPVLNSIFMGLGATYTVIPNLDLTCALSWVHYLPKDVTATSADTGQAYKVKYAKELYNISLGASYKM